MVKIYFNDDFDNENPDAPWVDKQPHPIEKTHKCPKCGVELKDLTHYSCNQNGCPLFAQVTY